MWCDMDPYDWLNKFLDYNFCVVAVVSIISRCDFELNHAIIIAHKEQDGVLQLKRWIGYI